MRFRSIDGEWVVDVIRLSLTGTTVAASASG
jgi:hypothetical protein